MADLRRLRRTDGLRRLFSETSLEPRHLVWPVFVREGIDTPEAIESLPGQFRWPLASVPELAQRVQRAKLGAVLLFGLPARKDLTGELAADPDGMTPRAVRAWKAHAPETVVITDVCYCSSLAHGHCGFLREGGMDHAATAEGLGRIAVAHAGAGADIVAPSSMVDGQVGAIRRALDASGMAETGVLGYSAKFASAYYGPFREAAGSAPAEGDRRAYQHDFRNRRHPLREVAADVEEGADALMVKPGLAYLDLVRDVREAFDLPLFAYHVSGEYAMVKAASERGWLDERAIVHENLTAFRRAGADAIITYHALEAAAWLREG